MHPSILNKSDCWGLYIHKRIIIRFRQAIDKPHIRKLIVTTGLDFENQKDRVVFWFGWQLYTLRLMFTVQAQIECHSKLFEHIICIMATSSHIEKGLYNPESALVTGR